jgi:phosphoenolpyruvate-protein kinase (PTS system EI component)
MRIHTHTHPHTNTHTHTHTHTHKHINTQTHKHTNTQAHKRTNIQIKAIFEASLELLAEGKQPHPRIEIPLVGNILEFLPLKALVRQIAKETGAEGKVKYEIGTMIEVPPLFSVCVHQFIKSKIWSLCVSTMQHY